MLNTIKVKKISQSDMEVLASVFQPALDYVPATHHDPNNCVMATIAGIYITIASKIQLAYLNPGKKFSLKLSTAQAFAFQSYVHNFKTANAHTMAVFSYINTSINQQLISITPMKKI